MFWKKVVPNAMPAGIVSVKLMNYQIIKDGQVIERGSACPGLTIESGATSFKITGRRDGFFDVLETVRTDRGPHIRLNVLGLHIDSPLFGHRTEFHNLGVFDEVNLGDGRQVVAVRNQ